MTGGIQSSKSRVRALSRVAAQTVPHETRDATVAAFAAFLERPKSDLANVFNGLDTSQQRAFTQLASHLMHEIKANIAMGGDSAAIAEDMLQTIDHHLHLILGSADIPESVATAPSAMAPMELDTISIYYRSESMVAVPLMDPIPEGESLDKAIRESSIQVLKQLAAMPKDILTTSKQSNQIVHTLRCRNDVMYANRLLHEALESDDDDEAQLDAWLDKGSFLKAKIAAYEQVRHANPIPGFTELLDAEMSWKNNFEDLYTQIVSEAELGSFSAMSGVTETHAAVRVADIRTLSIENVLTYSPYRSSEGTYGVQIVATPSGTVVIKQTDFIDSEWTANMVATRLNLPVPPCRHIPLTKEAATALLSRGLKAEPTLMMTFVPGANFEHASSEILSTTFNSDTPEGLRQSHQLGRIFAFDVFIANRDRFPAPVNMREVLGDLGIGNSGNMMVTADHQCVAIDQVFGLSQLDGKEADYLVAAGKLVFDIRHDTKEGYLALAGISGMIEAFGGTPMTGAGIAELRHGFLEMAAGLAAAPLSELMHETPHANDRAATGFLAAMQAQFSRNLLP